MHTNPMSASARSEVCALVLVNDDGCPAITAPLKAAKFMLSLSHPHTFLETLPPYLQALSLLH